MKKSLVALAIFGAFAGVAQAQSAVVIYGSFDGGVRQIDNVDALGNNKTSVSSTGTYNSNRLGFKGTEDLGNGMNAHFNLESGFNTGTGTSDSIGASNSTARLFNRTASVGLGGAFGSLDFGRQYSISFRTIGAYDPFNYKYTGIIPLAGAAAGGTSLVGAGTTASNFGGTRFDNDIQYTGTFGAITARAEYAPGEVAGSAKSRSAAAVGLSFAQGPFSAGAAYTEKKVSPAFTATGANFDDKSWTIGGAYKVAAFRVSAGYNNEKIKGAFNTGVAAVGNASQRISWLGGSYLVAPAIEVTAAWYHTRLDTPAATTAFLSTKGTKDLAIVGVTYALSKRTSVYGDIDVTKLKGNQVMVSGASSEDRTTGLSIGVNHYF